MKLIGKQESNNDKPVKVRTVKEGKKIPDPIREALKDILVGELSRSANNKWKTKEILVKLVLEHFDIPF
jgi:hypothetical protein